MTIGRQLVQGLTPLTSSGISFRPSLTTRARSQSMAALRNAWCARWEYSASGASRRSLTCAAVGRTSLTPSPSTSGTSTLGLEQAAPTALREEERRREDECSAVICDAEVRRSRYRVPTMERSSDCLLSASARILASTRLTSCTGRRRNTSSASTAAQSSSFSFSPISAVRLRCPRPVTEEGVSDVWVMVEGRLGAGDRRKEGPGCGDMRDAALWRRGVAVAMALWRGCGC